MEKGARGRGGGSSRGVLWERRAVGSAPARRVWRRRIVPEEDFDAYLPEVFYARFRTPPMLREVERALRGAAGVLLVGAVDATTKEKRL